MLTLRNEHDSGLSFGLARLDLHNDITPGKTFLQIIHRGRIIKLLRDCPRQSISDPLQRVVDIGLADGFLFSNRVSTLKRYAKTYLSVPAEEVVLVQDTTIVVNDVVDNVNVRIILLFVGNDKELSIPDAHALHIIFSYVYPFTGRHLFTVILVAGENKMPYRFGYPWSQHRLCPETLRDPLRVERWQEMAVERDVNPFCGQDKDSFMIETSCVQYVVDGSFETRTSMYLGYHMSLS